MYKYTITTKDKLVFLNMSGRLMIDEDAKEMQDNLFSIINSKLNTVIIDFQNLEYCNSSGLNSLITILTKTRNLGGDTIITNIPEKINELLIITKLNTVFNIIDNIDDFINKNK